MSSKNHADADARAFAALFRTELTRFRRALPGTQSVPLQWESSVCPQGGTRGDCASRDLGYVYATGDRWGGVVFVRRVLQLPRANWLGLIRHELGHVADPCWRETGAEQRADDLARLVTGVKIRYDENDVQTVSPRGRYPRPKYLHR